MKKSDRKTQVLVTPRLKDKPNSKKVDYVKKALYYLPEFGELLGQVSLVNSPRFCAKFPNMYTVKE